MDRDRRNNQRELPRHHGDLDAPGPKSNADPSTLADAGLDAGPTAGGTPGEEARSVNNADADASRGNLSAARPSRCRPGR